MATGEKKFTTAGREVKKFEKPPPLKPGVYKYKVQGDSVVVKSGQDSGVQYVTVALELLDTADEKFNFNRKLFCDFYLSTTPGKDGVPNTDRQNGIVAFARSVGQEMTDIDCVDVHDQKKGKDIEILNPLEVKKWIATLDGVEGQAKVKPETYTNKSGEKDYALKIDYFVEGKGAF